MASDILHIKDSYYFEVPSFLWAPQRESIEQFPRFWVRLDPEFQAHEAHELAHQLVELAEGEAPSEEQLVQAWHDYQHADHRHDGRPFDVFIEDQYHQLQAQYGKWKSADPANASVSFREYLNETEPQYQWFAARYDGDAEFQRAWNVAKETVGGPAAVDKYALSHTWDKEKVDAYNDALAGKVLIPQPFGGELRNLYQPESGFCLSKFMIIELVVALLLILFFGWLGARARSGGAPRGRIWNMLEAMLVFIRDQVARPAIGDKDADQFVPLLWTIFMFILFCNLFGMLPWMGAPTGAIEVTLTMAVVIFGAGMLAGMKRFGPVGFFLNQVPHMDIPGPMAYLIKPMVFVIEVVGMGIKHGVLAIRLFANMVAGHLVLLGIMGLAFGLKAALQFQELPTAAWGATASAVVVFCALFSLLELLVAFLQAYIFTFLSALFISAAVHHH